MSTATRTDIHRPSAPEFDPEAYDCLGVFDLAPEWGDGGDRVQTVRRALAEGFRFGGPHGSGQCGHCGARMRYAALMAHRPTSVLLWVGETCLDNRFDLTKGEFRTLRETSALNRERQAKAARIEALVEEFPVLAWLTYPEAIEECGGFVGDLAFRLRRDGRLSERQIAAVGPAIARDTARAEERAAREAARAAEVERLSAAGVEVPEGRIVVEGVALTVKWQDNAFGGALKMLVQTDEGWKVWGTAPSSLYSQGFTQEDGSIVSVEGVDKGDRVRFTATVERSSDDALFGFYKRPTKAEFVSRAPRP